MLSLRGFEKVNRVSEVDFQLPERSTKCSAGYDFYACESFDIPSHLSMLSKNANSCISFNSVEIVKPYCIKTGIKAYMQEDEVLELFIRSSSPSKLGLVMANSVGIIDADYYNNIDNEGEIGFLVYNLTPNSIHIEKGMKIGQGIFTKFLLIDNDEVSSVRAGGYGSTGE